METFISILLYILLAILIVVGIYLLRRWINGPQTPLKRSLEDNIIIVTGSSDGLGKETALTLLKDGATVIFACRNEKKTMNVIQSISDRNLRDKAIFIRLDMASFASVNSFIKEFKRQFDTLDILVNNAGGMFLEYQLTENKIEMNLQVNSFSTFLLTQGLLDILHRSNGRVITIASHLYSKWTHGADYYDLINVEDYDPSKPKFQGRLQYSMSKMGIMYFTQQLNEYCLTNQLNVKVCCIHPGVIMTNLFFNSRGYWIYPFAWLFTKTVKMGIQTTLHCCYLNASELQSGAQYVNCAIKEMNSVALNAKNREAFFRMARLFIKQYGIDQMELVI